MLDIALVSYLNTRPFMDGFDKWISPETARFHLVPPSTGGQMFRDKEVQLALIPAGSLPGIEGIEIMPDFCIGADGAVESVFIFSHQPIETLDSVILDRHSRTSNGLARILLRDYWNQEVELSLATGKHFDQISGSTGGVVIGDKAIKIRDQYPYAYDLAEIWKLHTGLPFAFAVWAYYPDQVSQEILDQLTQAMDWGVARAVPSAEKWADFYGIPLPFARKYLEHCIDFHFDAPKHKAFHLYLELLNSLPALSFAFS